MMLSHASSVSMVTLDDISTKEGFGVLSVIKFLMATQTKDVVLLIAEEKCPEWTNAISSCVDLKILKKPVSCFCPTSNLPHDILRQITLQKFLSCHWRW